MSDRIDDLRDAFVCNQAALVRLATHLTADPHVAEELVQDAFLRLHRHPRVLRTRDESRLYLRQTVVNLCRDRWRRQSVERRYRLRSLYEVGPKPDVYLDIDLIRALQRLPYRKRVCISLRFLCDLSEAETAEIMKIAKGTVKSQTSKGLRELAILLTASEEPSSIRIEKP